MTKSQEYFQNMMTHNKEAFDEFRVVHDAYDPSARSGQVPLNEKGEVILAIIRKYENLLCGYSESSKYGKFSDKTADTFWKYIRAEFPKIDFIGVR